MTTRQCDECEQPYYSKGLCQRHYNKQWQAINRVKRERIKLDSSDVTHLYLCPQCEAVGGPYLSKPEATQAAYAHREQTHLTDPDA